MNRLQYLYRNQLADIFMVHTSTIDRWKNKGKKPRGSQRPVKLPSKEGKFYIDDVKVFAKCIGKESLL
jgi:transposase